MNDRIAPGPSRLWAAVGLTIYKNINRGVIHSEIFYGKFCGKDDAGSSWQGVKVKGRGEV